MHIVNKGILAMVYSTSIACERVNTDILFSQYTLCEHVNTDNHGVAIAQV